MVLMPLQTKINYTLCIFLCGERLFLSSMSMCLSCTEVCILFPLSDCMHVELNIVSFVLQVLSDSLRMKQKFGSIKSIVTYSQYQNWMLL